MTSCNKLSSARLNTIRSSSGTGGESKSERTQSIEDTNNVLSHSSSESLSFTTNPEEGYKYSKLLKGFTESKTSLYNRHACGYNIHRFLKKYVLGDPSMNGSVHVIYCSSPNSFFNYGKVSFANHVFLMAWDEGNNQWKALDYDMDQILGENKRFEMPLGEYLKMMCSKKYNERMYESIKSVDFFKLQDLPNYIIFKPQEWSFLIEKAKNEEGGEILRSKELEDGYDLLSFNLRPGEDYRCVEKFLQKTAPETSLISLVDMIRISSTSTRNKVQQIRGYYNKNFNPTELGNQYEYIVRRDDLMKYMCSE